MIDTAHQTDNFKSKLILVLGVLAVMWLIRFIDLMPFISLAKLGIYPRTWHGLIGVLFAPFIHGNINHIILNSIPFLVLGVLVSLRGIDYFIKVSLVITIISGLIVWLLARPAYHIGASGLIFGYFGFLLFRGYFERSFTSILLAILTIVFYGSMIFTLLRLDSYLSWESHIAGFLTGALLAKFMYKSSDKNTQNTSEKSNKI